MFYFGVSLEFDSSVNELINCVNKKVNYVVTMYLINRKLNSDLIGSKQAFFVFFFH